MAIFLHKLLPWHHSLFLLLLYEKSIQVSFERLIIEMHAGLLLRDLQKYAKCPRHKIWPFLALVRCKPASPQAAGDLFKLTQKCVPPASAGFCCVCRAQCLLWEPMLRLVGTGSFSILTIAELWLWWGTEKRQGPWRQSWFSTRNMLAPVIEAPYCMTCYFKRCKDHLCTRERNIISRMALSVRQAQRHWRGSVKMNTHSLQRVTWWTRRGEGIMAGAVAKWSSQGNSWWWGTFRHGDAGWDWQLLS